MLRRFFRWMATALYCVSALLAVWQLVISMQWLWVGVVLIAAAPAAQVMFSFDRLQVPHHKVRLPLVSVLVFAGLALVLLTTAQSDFALWLALANVGVFLLDAYWARDDQIPDGSG